MSEGDIWTPADIAELTRRWDDGESAGVIAQTFGRSRSAICGRVHRLRLAGHVFQRKPTMQPVIKTDGPKIRRSKERTVRIAAPAFREARFPRPTPVDTSHAKPWLARTYGQCAAPVGGEGADTLSCCAPSGEHTYCRAHRAIFHVRPSESSAQLQKRGVWLAGRAA